MTNPTRTRRIWARLTRDPQASIREIAAAEGVAFSTVAYHIERLERLGYVTRPAGCRARRVVVGLYTSRESTHEHPDTHHA